MKESFIPLLDLILSNFHDIKTLKSVLEKELRDKDIINLLVLLEIIESTIKRVNKRINLFNEYINLLEKLIRGGKTNTKKFLEIHNSIIEETKNIENKLIKQKKVNKAFFRKLLNMLNLLIDIYFRILEKLTVIKESFQQLKINYLIVNYRALKKLNNLKEKDDFVFLIKDLIFNSMENYKIINDFFIEIKEKNLVVILRKDSLYLKDYLILENILNLEKLNDFELYKKYWKNEITPSEEENEELEKYFLENQELGNFYKKLDSREFLIKYYYFT